MFFIKRVKSRDLAACAILFTVVLVFFWRVLIGGKVLLPIDSLFSTPPWSSLASAYGVGVPHNDLIADMILQNYSWKNFVKESYLNGEFPLWNPYLFGGVPFLAAGQYAALYPLGFLFVVLPVAQAYGWFIALHVFLAGLFTYIFLRVLRVERIGALTGAIVFAFSGFLVVSYVWPMIVSTAIWLPLILAMIERIVQKAERNEPHLVATILPEVVVGGVAVGLQFLAGHMEISFYVLFSMMFYAGTRLLWFLFMKRNVGRVMLTGVSLCVMVGLGFGLAAAQLIPFFEVIKENYRAGMVTYDDVIGWALPKKHVFSFLMPDFFGNPAHHTYLDFVDGQTKQVANAFDFSGYPRSYPFWGVKNYVEGTSYLGVGTLALALVAVAARRSRYVLIFALYAVFSLLLAFGSPLYKFLWIIPGFDQLHTPFRWILPYSFATAVLAAFGAEYILGKGSELSTERKGFSGFFAKLIPILLLIGGLGTLLGLLLSRVSLDSTIGLANRLLEGSKTMPSAFESGQMLYSYMGRNLAIFGIFALFSGGIYVAARLQKRRQRFFQAAAILVLIADLFVFGYDFTTTSDTGLLNAMPGSLSYLKEDKSLYRTVTFNYDDTLRPNSNMIAGIQDARGYDTIILRQYVEYWRLMEEPSGLLYSMINKLVDAKSLESPFLDLLNVKYILTTQNIGLPHLKEVYRGEINIYENEDVFPRAFLVYGAESVAGINGPAIEFMKTPTFRPREQVLIEPPDGGAFTISRFSQGAPHPEIIDYGPTEVTVRTTIDQDGYLILTDTFFPGWRVDVDGIETDVLKANSIFRAVSVSPGDHTIVFKYSPLSFRVGLLLSLVTFLVSLLAAGLWGWRRFFTGIGEASTVQRIAKNSALPMAAQLLNRLLDFAFAILVARLLGPEIVGRFSLAVVMIGYFAIFTDFGLGTLMTREISRDREQAGKYLGNTIIARFGLCVLSIVPLIGIIALYKWQFGLTEDTIYAILLFGLSLFPSSVSSSLSAAFYSFEKMEYPAAINVVTAILKVLFGMIALLMGWGIVGLAGASVVVSLLTAIILYWLVRTVLFSPKFTVSANFSFDMVHTSFPLMINNFLSTIFFKIDIMLIQPIQGDRVTGWYSTAYKFVDGLNIIPAFFTMAIFPVMSRYAQSARDSLLRSHILSIKLLLLVAMPITFGTTVVADKIILLFFTEEFAPSIAALQILIWFLPFSYINSVTQYVLIAVDQQKFLTFAFIIGVVFNIVANLIAIPYFGLVGASLVTVLSEIVLLIPFMYAVRKHIGSIPLLSLTWRPTFAASIMAAVTWLLHDFSLVLIIPAAGFTYLLVLVVLRTFGEEDRAVLAALRRR